MTPNQSTRNRPLSFFLLFCLLTIVLNAQDQRFIGTFLSADQTLSAQTKYVDGEYQGVLSTGTALYAYKGVMEDGVLKGELFGGDRIFKYVSTSVDGGITVESEGNTVMYFQISETHELANVDLTPYFKAPPTPQTVSQPAGAPAPTGKFKDLFNIIAGSQLVYYQRTSILNDNTASSITYVNFCPNGTFNMNSDSSYSVQGGRGGNVHGASQGGGYGTWRVEEIQGAPVLAVTYANGQGASYPINLAHLNAGKWRVGNTQYAIQRNGAVCQ
nr:hypothetical protein [Allomuricauda sp.]